MGKIKIILDVDPGVDDVDAIMMALSASELVDILAITCVAGNTNVDQCCYNALKVLTLWKRTEIPVYRGASKALVQDKIDGSIHHGKDGLGDAIETVIPDTSLIQQEHAVSALIRLVNEHKGEITLVALGPLTNIALALRLDPELGTKLKNTVIMGGNMEGRGNIVVAREFNFYCDPEAAYIVLRDLECPIQLLTWEACMNNGLEWDWYDKLHDVDTEKSRFHYAINQYSTRRKKDHFKAPMYFSCDPTAMVITINQACILESQKVYCEVELAGKLTRGQMVVDWSAHLGKEPNVELVTKVNSEEIMKYYTAMLAQ